MKKRIVLVSAAIAVAAMATAGGAVAYFSNSTDPVNNAIITGEAAIELHEEEEWESGDPQTLNPGSSIAKTPVVENTGSVDVYVRLLINIDSDTAALFRSKKLSFVNLNKGDYSWTGLSNLENGIGGELVASLNTPLAVGDTSPAIFEGLTLAPSYVEGEAKQLNITIAAEAIQVIEGKTPAECWELL